VPPVTPLVTHVARFGTEKPRNRCAAYTTLFDGRDWIEVAVAERHVTDLDAGPWWIGDISCG
jgi:hypothetical protein